MIARAGELFVARPVPIGTHQDVDAIAVEATGKLTVANMWWSTVA